jgi:hypothetical protein
VLVHRRNRTALRVRLGRHVGRLGLAASSAGTRAPAGRVVCALWSEGHGVPQLDTSGPYRPVRLAERQVRQAVNLRQRSLSAGSIAASATGSGFPFSKVDTLTVFMAWFLSVPQCPPRMPLRRLPISSRPQRSRNGACRSRRKLTLRGRQPLTERAGGYVRLTVVC